MREERGERDLLLGAMMVVSYGGERMISDMPSSLFNGQKERR